MPARNCPRLCRIEGHWDGKPVTRETQFDYPEKGPADIYDLGVPKTTKLVDRVPAGDLKRISGNTQAGRERMDNYRAVFVNRIEGIDYIWWTERPKILYRKGDRFRTDYVGGGRATSGHSNAPPKARISRKWWFERTKLFRFFPTYVLTRLDKLIHPS